MLKKLKLTNLHNFSNQNILDRDEMIMSIVGGIDKKMEKKEQPESRAVKNKLFATQ